MPRLPDIPVQSWLDDQVNRFQQATSGHLDSLFFEDQARQQEAVIPPDFDAPGGMDQWEEAAKQRRVEELRQQQEADEQRIATQQAQAQAQQQAQAEQEQAQEAQRAQQSAGVLSSLGIPSPEEAFSDFQHWWNKPKDNVGTSGVFDAAPRPGTEQPLQNDDGSVTTERSITINDPGLNGGRATNIPTVWNGRVVSDDEAVDNAIRSGSTFPGFDSVDEAVQAAEQRSRDLGTGQITSIGGARVPRPSPEPASGRTPAGDFMSWAKDLTGSLLPSPDTTETAPPTAPPESYPSEPIPSESHSSTSGIFDRVAEVAKTAVEPLVTGYGRMAENIGQGRLPSGQTVSELASGMKQETPKMVDEFGRRMMEHSMAPSLHRQQELQAEQLAFLGEDVPPAARFGQTVDPRWAEAEPEKAEELRTLNEEQMMAVAGMVGANNLSSKSRAIEAIKALRASKLGEDVILAAERSLANNLGSTLLDVQALTRGKKFAAAALKAEAERDKGITTHPEYVAHDAPVQTASEAEDIAFSALEDARTVHGPDSPQYHEAESAWIDASGAHYAALEAQQKVRDRLLGALPGVEQAAAEAPASVPTLSQAQKAYKSTEEIYATAVTAERDAARRFGPGSEEHQAIQQDLEYVTAQLERRRAALAEAEGRPPIPRDPGGEGGAAPYDPYALTDEDRALNAAAAARARAAPPHGGYLEDPTFTGEDDLEPVTAATNLVATPPAGSRSTLPAAQGIARSTSALPEQAPDTVRVVHVTSSPETAEAIARTGLRYPETGIENTTIAFHPGTPVSGRQWQGTRTGGENPVAVVLDIPRSEYYGQHHGIGQEGHVPDVEIGQQRSGLVGRVDPDRVVGVMPLSELDRPPASPAAGSPLAPPGRQTPSAAGEAGASPIRSETGFEIGQPVTTPDGRVGKVGGRRSSTVRGETTNEVMVYHPDGDVTRHNPTELRAAGQPPAATPEEQAARTVAEALRQPTPAEAALPSRLPPPPDPVDPPRPGAGPPSTPEGVQSASDDYDMVDAMLTRVDNRGGSTRPTASLIKQVQDIILSTKNATTDRRARLGAAVKFFEGIKGSKLQPNENAWLLSRIYEGREDAALARMERMLQDPLTRVGQDNMRALENVAIQLDNVDVDWLVRAKEQARVERTIPEVRGRQRAPPQEIRRTGEAKLKEDRAKASLRSAEREWVAANNEKRELLKIIDATGEGPTTGVESAYQARKRKLRGQGPSRSMETDRSLSAQERLEKNAIRLETAKARHADARQIVDDIVADRQNIAQAKTEIRAIQSSEQVGEKRKYSGGASPQQVDDILANLVKRVGPEKAKHITDALDSLYKYRDAVRDRLVESGVWSKETGEHFKVANPYYIPTKILDKLDDKYLQNLPTGARTFSSRSDLIKHVTPEGTELDRMAPVRSILQMGFQAESVARRNDVMKAVLGYADEPGMNTLVRKITAEEAKHTPKGWTNMSVMVDGKAQSIAVEDKLAKSLDMASPAWGGVVGAVLKGATFPLRAGATALRPAFIAANAVNDAGLTLFRFAAEDPWYQVPNPVRRTRDLLDLFKGYHTSFGAANLPTQIGTGGFAGATVESTRQASEGNYPWNDPDYWTKVGAGGVAGAGIGAARRIFPVNTQLIQRFRESGASQGMSSRFRNPVDIQKELAGKHVWVRTAVKEGDFADILNSRMGQASDILGMLWSRPLEQVGSVIEKAPRYAAFQRAERQVGNEITQEIALARRQGHVISEAQEAELRAALMSERAPEVANKARRVTADFAAGGSFVKTMNQVAPFLNASTQALAESGDMLQKNPAGYMAATAGIVAATILTEIHNRSVAPEDYKNISDFTKNTGLVILSDKEPEGEGKRGLVYIPTRGGPGAPVPLVKAMMSKMFGDDPRTWKKLAGDVGLATVNQLSPVNADLGGLVGMFVPPILSLWGQARSNYDYFRGQPIVGRSQESQPLSEQYDDRTSQFARHVARHPEIPLIGGHSPLMLDWFLRNASPGPSEAFLSVADNVIKRTGNELPSTQSNVPKGARDVPMVGAITGRFLRTVGGAEQNRAYDLADEIIANEEPDLVRELESTPMYLNATPDRQRQMMSTMRGDLEKKARLQAGVEENTRDLGAPKRWRGVDPGSALEKEIVTAIGTPKEKRTSRQDKLADNYQGEDLDAYTTWRQKQMKESDKVRDMVRGR